MKVTKQRIKEIIQEELEAMTPPPARRRMTEEDAINLAELQPAVDGMVKQIESAAEKASEGQDSIKNLLLQSLIAQLQALVG